jgi:pre-mRNA-processing factor 40
MPQFQWKEYKTDTGRVYYHNLQTKETTWTKPKELEDSGMHIQQQQQQQQQQQFQLLHQQQQMTQFMFAASQQQHQPVKSMPTTPTSTPSTPQQDFSSTATSAIDHAIKTTLANIVLPSEPKADTPNRYSR